MGGGPAQAFSSQFIEEDLTPLNSVSNAVGTTTAPGEISHPLPKNGKIAIVDGNQFFHSVTNNLCLSNSNSSLIEPNPHTFEPILDKLTLSPSFEAHA